MKTKKNINSIEEQDNYIQTLSIAQLKEMDTNSAFVLKNNLSKNTNNEDFINEIDDYIQNMQLSELREIENDIQNQKQIDEHLVRHKSKITGLECKVIIIIETKKEKATLEQLLTYCNKLHIPYQKMLPELFY